MRVLHVITGLAAGGAETQLQLLLQHTRHDAEVIALYNAGSVAGQLRAEGVRVFSLDMRSNKEIGAIFRLTQLMRKGRFEVVHTHLYRACLYGRLAARLAGVPRIVATEHSLLDDQLEGRPATRSVRLLYRIGESLGEQTIAVSDAVRANLLRWGIAPERVVRVPNGLDLPGLAFDPAQRVAVRTAHGIPHDAEVVGAVGRLHPGKCFDELVTTLAPTLGRHRRLLIVGEGVEAGALTELALRFQVADYVHLVGEQPVAPYLSAMDVLASPSRYETFGLAVLEALASGLPVVYRRCPALEELSESVPSAVRLTTPGPGLLAAVESALSSRIGDRAPHPALTQLSIEHVVATIDDLYATMPARRETVHTVIRSVAHRRWRRAEQTRMRTDEP
jgi:glycosyltransferase involved in cell wall biosynthesis